MTRTKTLAQHLASAIQARKNCEQSGNTEWFARHTESIESLAGDFLPSGSGVDNGSTVDMDKSTGEKIVIQTAFHHMNDGGMYDGWTEHVVTVRPAFDGFEIQVSGRDRNQIKDYLGEMFAHVLGEMIVHDADGFRRAVALDAVETAKFSVA